jgi:hypothetical protein
VKGARDVFAKRDGQLVIPVNGSGYDPLAFAGSMIDERGPASDRQAENRPEHSKRDTHLNS